MSLHISNLVLIKNIKSAVNIYFPQTIKLILLLIYKTNKYLIEKNSVLCFHWPSELLFTEVVILLEALKLASAYINAVSISLLNFVKRKKRLLWRRLLYFLQITLFYRCFYDLASKYQKTYFIIVPFNWILFILKLFGQATSL